MNAPASLHSKNALLAGLVLLVVAPLGAPVVAAAAVGAVLSALNLWGLERTVNAVLGLAQVGQGGAVQALVALRFAGVMALFAVLLIAFRVDPLGFALGFSTAVPAVLWHGLSARRSEV